MRQDRDPQEQTKCKKCMRLSKRYSWSEAVYRRRADNTLAKRNWTKRFDFDFDFWWFNATFSNISTILWRQVLVVEEAGVSGENHRPWASNWYTLSFAAASRVRPFLQLTKLGTNTRRISDRLVWAAWSHDLTHWATRTKR
jgi:hypothetical protein